MSLNNPGGGLEDRHIRVFNTETGQCTFAIDVQSQVCTLQFSVHYKELLSSHSTNENQLILWSFPSMRQIGVLEGHSNGRRPLYVAVSPDGQTVASASGDENLKFWKCWEMSSLKRKQTQRNGVLSSTEDDVTSFGPSSTRSSISQGTASSTQNPTNTTTSRRLLNSEFQRALDSEMTPGFHDAAHGGSSRPIRSLRSSSRLMGSIR